MNFIIFSDIHLHNWAYGSNYLNGFNSRLIFQARVLRQIEHYAEEHNVKEIYFTGDLFHTHHTLHLGPLTIAAKIFQQWKQRGIKLTLLVGNHDIADKRKTFHSLEPFKDTARVIEYGDFFDGEDHRVHALPYTENEQILNDFLDYNFPKDTILLMHQGVANVPVNSKGFIINDEILNPNNIPSNIKWAFVGHYHSHKIINNLVIPGSALQHTWADEGEKRGWLHVTDSGIKHIESRVPKFITVNKIDNSLKGNYVKLSQIDEDFKTILKQAKEAGAIAIEIAFDNKETSNTFKGEKLKLETLIDDYGKFKKFDKSFIELGKRLAFRED